MTYGEVSGEVFPRPVRSSEVSGEVSSEVAYGEVFRRTRDEVV